MSKVQLKDIATVIQGGRNKLSGKNFVDDGFPAYGAGGMNGFLPSYEFEQDAVILSAIGARCGKCFHASGKWSSLANTQVILPHPEMADARFLWWQLNDEQRWPRSGTAQPFIKPSNVKSHLVALPPMAEQRRIADILDQADALRRKQQEADQCAEDLISSAMQHMVGPLHPDHDRWPEFAIEDLADPEKGSMRTGPFGSALKHSEFVDQGIAVLGIDNAVKNRFAWDQRRYITEDKYQGLIRYTVKPGDVIVTIMGTCGRSAVVPDNIPPAITTKHLATITVDRNKCLPEYLSNAIHRHPGVLAQITAANRGAIMAGLNLGIIRKVKVRLPPISLQEKFQSIVRQTRSLQEQSASANREADALFRSLSFRYFG